MKNPSKMSYPGNVAQPGVHRGVRYTVFGRCSHRFWPWEWYVSNPCDFKGPAGLTIASGGTYDSKIAHACAKAAIDAHKDG